MKKLAVAVVLLVAAIFPVADFTAGQDVLDFATVQKAAEQGHAEAQRHLGISTQKGFGPHEIIKNNSGGLLMAWLKLMGYFAMWIVVFMGVAEVYGLLLRRTACLPRPLPVLLGTLLFGVLACVYALSFLGLQFVLQGTAFDTCEDTRLVVVLVCALCLVPSLLLFRYRHSATLKSLGYFQ